MARALIVEDGTLFRQLVYETLRSRFPSIEIHDAEGEVEALEKIKTFLPDLVFIDILLREGNGLELTKKIKTDYPNITVVILTNYDLPEYREAALIWLIIYSQGLSLLE
jgi:CheY-like chemotaxis protein